MENNKKLKIVTTTVRDFLTSPKDFISKIISENLARLVITLNNQSFYLSTKEMYELFVKLEVRKERAIFEKKYRELKESFRKVKEDVDLTRLTKFEQTLIQLEEKFHLFDGLTHGELLAVVKNIRVFKMQKDEKVFLNGNTTKEIFFLIDGEINIVISENIVATLPKRTFFGEMAYITDKPRNATAMIKSPIAIMLSFNIKDNVNKYQTEAFMKLYKNINSMLVGKIEGMNKRACQ